MHLISSIIPETQSFLLAVSGPFLSRGSFIESTGKEFAKMIGHSSPAKHTWHSALIQLCPLISHRTELPRLQRLISATRQGVLWTSKHKTVTSQVPFDNGLHASGC